MPRLDEVGEEVLAKKMTLAQVVEYVAGIVARRAAAKKNYGVLLLPEGLIEFVPEIKELISSLNDVMAGGKTGEDAVAALPASLAALMRSLGLLLLLVGAGLLADHFAGLNLEFLGWVNNWGEYVAWAIRVGPVLLGLLLMAGGKKDGKKK